jgi:hypothetical protein
MMVLLLRWDCEGEIKIENENPSQIKFTVEWESGKEARIRLTEPETNLLDKLKMRPARCTIHGRILTMWAFNAMYLQLKKYCTCEHILIEEVKWEENAILSFANPIMNSFRPFSFSAGSGFFLFSIVNCDFQGTEWSHNPDGSGKSNVMRVMVEGKEFCFTEQPVSLGDKKESISFCTLKVDAELTEKERIVEYVTNLCDLLSFANGQYVDYTGWSYFNHGDENLVEGQFKGSMESAMKKSHQPLISNLPPEDLRDFLEKSFPTYRSLKVGLGLNYLVGYFTKIRREEYLETKCLHCYILLECLADKARKYFIDLGKPVPNESIGIAYGRIRRAQKASSNPELKAMSEVIAKELAGAIADPNPPLPTVIRHLRNHFGVKKDPMDETIFDWRKEFIHKGLSQVDPATTYNEIYLVLLNSIDRLILKILGHTGAYCDAKKRWERVQLP